MNILLMSLQVTFARKDQVTLVTFEVFNFQVNTFLMHF